MTQSAFFYVPLLPSCGQIEAQAPFPPPTSPSRANASAAHFMCLALAQCFPSPPDFPLNPPLQLGHALLTCSTPSSPNSHILSPLCHFKAPENPLFSSFFFISISKQRASWSFANQNKGRKEGGKKDPLIGIPLQSSQRTNFFN